MRIKIKKRNGYWKIWFSYYSNTPGAYELYIEKYASFREAWAVANVISKSLAW